MVANDSTQVQYCHAEPTVQLGQLFMPMHYAKTNQLTKASFDPHSRQPSYKFCAVNVVV
ncbi:hypothetical protein JO972_08575 [Verrucomicrobiaceae bacterium 5K15]|uniref:Molybdopterin dinucleotide-binding domain-containing protein n=1 Tax=Oceaniferula flava TaxID=2800421 RepID=A0AAE2VCH6_9BACT|nr:hypothetical protein [Oceaniferula flavus]MBM1136317.1 hypothetical protein [Oceaniferula flavus]